MNADSFYNALRESEERFLKCLPWWAAGIIFVGMVLVSAEIIDTWFFHRISFVALMLTLQSTTGRLMLAGQKDGKPLNFTRWAIVQVISMGIPLVGLYLLEAPEPPPKTNLELIEETANRDWPDDFNIEPDGMPSESGVVH